MNNRLPSFSDYRRTSDGVQVADLGFKKQLWALDPELDVVWDWASSRWEIWRFPGQQKKKVKRIDNKSYHIMTVQTQGRTFRELGADIILKLQKGDTHRFSTKELIRYFDQMDKNVQRERRRKMRDQISSRSKEVAWYLYGNPYRAQVPKRFMEGTKFLFEGPSNTKRIARVLTDA